MRSTVDEDTFVEYSMKAKNVDIPLLIIIIIALGIIIIMIVDYIAKKRRKNAKYYLEHGIAWCVKKDYDKAIADYSEAIRIDPKSVDAFINRGIAWCYKKEYDKAIADYSEAIRIDPKSAVTYYNRGYAWEDKKEFDKAIADYSVAIGLDPKSAYYLNALAWILATSPDCRYRDGKKAVDLAIKACGLHEWKNAYSIDTLAAAYAEAGYFDQAVKYVRMAIDLDPSQTQLNAHLILFCDKKPYRDEVKHF